MKKQLTEDAEEVGEAADSTGIRGPRDAEMKQNALSIPECRYTSLHKPGKDSFRVLSF